MDSMFLIMSILLIVGLMIVGFVIYTKTVVMESRADIQLDHLKAYSCDEIIKKHTTAHYLSKENKQYANQKILSCDKEI